MSTVKTLGLICCSVIALVSLAVYFRLSWSVWVRNLRLKAPPKAVPAYLVKTASSLFVACSSAYVALLIYDWRFRSFFCVFLGVTLVLLLFSTGNLWWEIYWGRRLHRQRKERDMEDRQQNGKKGEKV